VLLKYQSILSMENFKMIYLMSIRILLKKVGYNIDNIYLIGQHILLFPDNLAYLLDIHDKNQWNP